MHQIRIDCNPSDWSSIHGVCVIHIFACERIAHETDRTWLTIPSFSMPETVEIMCPLKLQVSVLYQRIQLNWVHGVSVQHTYALLMSRWNPFSAGKRHLVSVTSFHPEPDCNVHHQ